MVSETGERFRKLVCPALKYTDYCVINEMEASATTGIALRTEGMRTEAETRALYQSMR